MSSLHEPAARPTQRGEGPLGGPGAVLRGGHLLSGARTLLYKEVLRFWKVSFQTVAAPVLTAMMYLLIFGHVLEDHVKVFDQVGYTSFLIPGLVMMSVLQNAFANSSSSLIQSKITGNLVFLLVAPLTHWAWFVAYVGASIVRGVAVGTGVLLVTLWFAPLRAVEPWWIVVFALLGRRHDGLARADRGPVGGEVRPDGGVPELHHHADDVPLRRVLFGALAAAVLAGGEPPESVLLHDRRFRRGFFGVSDVSPWLSLAVVGSSFVVVAGVALHLLRIGYKIRH